MGSNKQVPEISRQIKLLREKAGLKQRELAEMLNTSRETINMWESGARMIKGDDIVRLAEALNTTCDYLLRGVESNQLDIHKLTALNGAAVSTLRYASEDSRQRWGEVLNALITHPWIIDILHKYLFLNIDKMGKWRDDIGATGAYAIKPGEYEDLVPLVDSNAGLYTAIEASMLGDVLLLAVEGELRKLKGELGKGGANGKHQKGT